MWTINDFLAYGMMSGWSTIGKLACLICMDETKAFSLKNGRKVSWFDCNQQFLPLNHEFRRNDNIFYKGREEKSRPPPKLTGEQVWEKIKGFPKITEFGPCNCYGYGKSNNWTKRSIFWDLPYWKTNLVRHNLDVMHIEKNVFDNIFHTIMDNSERTKDNEKARMDLKEYCRRSDLHLQQNAYGRWIKSKAKFTLNDDQKKDVCEWVHELKMLMDMLLISVNVLIRNI
ncbi:hypothetical protein AABB24_015666 [Solanum stoloniferum]|uniref:Uncharacterized protein n=1 Tax=Solanum stoloniferum TaxID=62892 RepID=A0ABD2TQX8_9SOLN